MKIILPILIMVISANVSNPQSLFKELNKNNLSGGEIVAEVGNIKITAEELFYSYEFGPAFIKRGGNSKNTHLKYMINEKLLALDGYDNGIFDDDETKLLFSDFSSDLATEQMFKDEILPKVNVNENEIDTVISTKLVEMELNWLYSSEPKDIAVYFQLLQEGKSFDSLFNSQINDTVFLDMRSMKVSAFDLMKKNPVLYKIVDTLTAGHYSAPIHTDDGWYIVKLNNIIKNMVNTETEYNKLRYEAEEAVTKFKMDALSDIFVDSLMRIENLVIKRDGFNILRSYLGKYVLENEKYEEWNLKEKLEKSLENLGLSENDEYPGIVLVAGANSSYYIDQFINWFRNRNLYIKFNKDDLISFSKSLENLVWLMMRDNILSEDAAGKGYFNDKWVVAQANWWKDKIAYSAVKNKMTESLLLENEEVNFNSKVSDSEIEKLSAELSQRIFRKVQQLKKKYPAKINENILNELNVSQENDKKAVEMYIVKKGGLIPRPAYPSIDRDWESWQ